jgi:AcrR family transcriptional regulator
MAKRPKLDSQVIIKAAANLADTVGLDRITLAAVAKNLSVKTPSLYNHIEGMLGLKRELAVFAVKSLTEKLTQGTIGKSGDEAVKSLLSAYREFAKERPGLYEAAGKSGRRDDEEMLAVRTQLISVMIKVLALYNLSEDNVIHATRVIRSIASGFILHESAGYFTGRSVNKKLDATESYQLMGDVFLLWLHSRRNSQNDQ